MKKISVITGVYNEEENVREVYEVIKNTFASLKKYDYEHIFMNNCSTDSTLEILKEIARQDKRVKIISYSKNFGAIKNEFTGYKYATGDAVICFEASLKDPPDLISIFIKHWEEDYKVVYGVRNKTKDNIFMASMRKMFYAICSFLSAENLPRNAGGFRLVDRVVVNELTKIDDYKPYTRGLITTIGFKQIGINYERKNRARGRSKSNIGYLVDFAINGIISYSVVPIRLCTYIGIGLSMLCFIGSFFYLIAKLTFWKAQIPALAGVILLFLFFFGIQLFFLGVIGEYVGAIHSQVRKKPFVVIEEKINID